MQNLIKSPLGTTTTLPEIETLIPRGAVVSSYTFYSGDVEFHLSSRNRFVNCNILKNVVMDFWQTVFNNPTSVYEFSSQLFPLKYEKEIEIIQENWSSYKNPATRAAIFFVLNNCTEEGWISKGTLNMDLLNPVLFSRLKRSRKPENIHLKKIDNVKNAIMNDTISDFTFLRLPKIKKEFLSEGMNIAVEEHKISFFNIYEELKNKKFIIATKPSKFIFDANCNIIYIDKYGLATDIHKATEVILHNV